MRKSHWAVKRAAGIDDDRVVAELRASGRQTRASDLLTLCTKAAAASGVLPHPRRGGERGGRDGVTPSES